MLDPESRDAVRRALAEDLGDAGDVTTDAVIPAGASGRATLLAREDAVIAGSDVFEAVFSEIDPRCVVEWLARDGDAVSAGAVVARVSGPLRALLAGERTALNFLQRLSGVASVTRRFVAAAPGVELRDTRKTTPGLRALEKAAVRAGGGVNHRMGLYEGIFLKDNHVAACGGVARAIERARAARPDLPLLVECESLDQVREAIGAGATEILLDNMNLEALREAVAAVAGRARTEASGGVTMDSIEGIAGTGVDAVSVGALTHSAPAVDLSLELEAAPAGEVG